MTAALQLSQGGRVLFSGTPPVLRGEVALENRSDEHLKVRRVATTAGAGLVVGDVRLAARLEPGTAARVPARLRVDAHTPAGRYTTNLEVDGHTVEAEVLVFERDAVEIQPRPLYLRGVAGETVSQPLVVTNRGNVAHTIPPAGSVHLGEKDWFGRSMVFALRETGEEEGHAAYLDRLFQEFRTTLPAPARLKVTSAGGDELAPGTTMELALEVVLPEGLVKGRRYVGRTTFLGAGLGLTVDCVGSPKTVKRRAR